LSRRSKATTTRRPLRQFAHGPEHVHHRCVDDAIHGRDHYARTRSDECAPGDDDADTSRASERSERLRRCDVEGLAAGDLTSLAELGEQPVAAFLAARSDRWVSWGDPQCEGAAGSSYCSWTRPEIQFVVRIGNELAYAGQPHAVRDAYFLPGRDRGAIWPVTTQAEANTTQAQVDQGHQPWLVDPAAVASAYAQAELGWDNATVDMVEPNQYELTDPASGAKADLGLTQPARAGEGGIWAVTRAGSV
jgi:hypothetical protein